MRAGATVLWIATGLLSACAERQPQLAGGRKVQAQGVLMGTDQGGSLAFVRRIDANIEQVFRAKVIGSETQFVVLTGREAGQDQCKLMVLTDSGSLLAEHRFSGVSPWPVAKELARQPSEPIRQPVNPVRDLVVSFQYEDRNYLTAVAQGNWGPSPLVLLEVVGSALRKRFVFWNYGHIHRVLVDGSHLVLAGVSNALHDNGYTPILAIFHLDDLLSQEGTSHTGQAPIRMEGESPEAGSFRYYMRMATDRRWRMTFWTLEIVDGVLHATTNSGLEYQIQLETGAVELVATDIYRSEFLDRPDRANLPAIEVHVTDLLRSLRVWRRTP